MKHYDKHIDTFFENFNNDKSPGCSLAVIQEGEIIFKKGYGMSNLEYSIPNQSDSVFYIASVSKQFAAMCILLLEEDGLLKLEDEVRKYIPGLPSYADRITISHLIHHTSGLRDFLGLFFLSGHRADELITNEQALDLICRQKSLNFDPGEEFLYCNSGYFLLSIITERVSGKTMREFSQERIFDPLGMKYTRFHDDRNELIHNKAVGYAPDDCGRFKVNAPGLETVGSGGIYSTVEDLYLWDQNFYENKLGCGKPSLIASMLTPGRLNNGKELDYAYGLTKRLFAGEKVIGHSGGFGGYSAQFIQFPERKLSIVCLSNHQMLNAPYYTFEVAKLFLKEKSDKVSLLSREIDNKNGLIDSQVCGLYYNDQTTSSLWVRMHENQVQIRFKGTWMNLTLQENGCYQIKDQKSLTEFKFEFKSDPSKVIIIGEDSKEETLERIQIYRSSDDEISTLTGEYYNDEMQAKAIIWKKNQKLTMKIGRHEMELDPTLKDLYLSSLGALQFTRDDSGFTNTMNVRAGRVRKIIFQRVWKELYAQKL
ncbi:MAG: serine hydrolase [Anaerolineaceae bacterium]|nr:serine hydrolase [Anaerolineaceae bacterium]